MKKSFFAAAALLITACFAIPAAAETFTTSDGVLSIELPDEKWKEMEDPAKWIALSDGSNILTIDHFSNGEKLPDMTVADDHYVNVYQGVFSTQNEVFIITGSVVDADKIPEITKMILSAKVLKYDTKKAVKKEDQPSVSEFSVAAVDKTMYVTADGLNVRAGCSTDDQILGSLGIGTAVQVKGIVQRNGEDYGWVQIAYGSGTGYVSASFLSDKEPEQKKDPETAYTGNVKTVYGEDGTAVTLYESTDGNWYDKSGTTYIRLSDDLFGVKDGNKRLTTYPPSGDTGASVTVYDETGATRTLYEGSDGLWRDRAGKAFTWITDNELQAYEGMEHVYTYDITQVTNDYNPEDYNQDNNQDNQDSGSQANGVVTAYDEMGTAVTLYENADGYWYDNDGTAYIRHSDTDFQVNEGNKHLTVY